MENIQIALDAIKEDGITLINIGKGNYFFDYLGVLKMLKRFYKWC